MIRGTVLALACALLLLGGGVSAQDEAATVRLDGRALFQVGAGAQEDATARALRIEGRLATLLRNLDGLAPAVTQPSGDGRIVAVAGLPVVTVTPADAQDNLTTVDVLAAQWAAAIDRGLQRARERRLSWGGRFVAETMASVEAAFARLGESTVRVVPRALAAFLVVGAFWLLARAVRVVLRLVFRRVVEDLTVESLIKQLAYYAIIGVGLVVAADALGFSPQTVVTGLGLTGLALGFALKDIISNFVSGVLILSLRPFEIGDQIVVGDTEGTVERIELRATRIRAYDGRVALVPNAELFTSRIVNNTADPVRRGSVIVHLGYEADLRRAIDTIGQAVRVTDGVLADRPVAVRAAELGPDDLVLEATFWTDSRRADFSNTCAAVRRAAVDALRAAGIGLPDPGLRTLTGPDDRAIPGNLTGTSSML